MISEEFVDLVHSTVETMVKQENKNPKRDVVFNEIPSKSDIRFTLKAMHIVSEAIKAWREKNE